MAHQLIKKFISGQLIVELLLAFGLSSILLPALLTGFVSAVGGREVYEQRLAATALLREAEEAIRSFRNEDWQNIALLDISRSYYPEIAESKWVLADGELPNVNGFTREISVFDVYRDSNRDIVVNGTPGSMLDPSTRKFLITVSWPGFVTRSIDSTIYITRYSNTFFSEENTVEAPTGGFGDWCRPAPSDVDVNLDRQGHATTVSAFQSDNETGNRVLTGTGANASGPAFSNIVIQGNDPPSFVSNTDYNGPPSIKVNGVFGDTNYAYLATDHQGMVILNLTSTPYQKISSFDPTSGNIQSQSVYVVGNTGYLLTDNKLYIVSISPDRTSITQIGSLTLSGGVKVVVDSGNQYAYVANPDPNGELKVVDVHSNPGGLSESDVKNVNVDGAAGRDVFINESATRAYLATAASANQPEFFIIDITDKSSPFIFPQGTYDTNGMDPKGVTVVSGGRAIIVGVEGYEYQVFTVVDDVVGFCPNHSENDDFLNIDSGAYGISSVLQSDQYAYSYVVTGDANAELKIIEGGPGTGGVGGNGTFESETLPIPDPGHDVVFNSFTATIDPDISYKIAIKHGVSGSCSGVTFDDSDFVSFVPGPLPVTSIGVGYVNPGQCLRYRAIDSGSVPVTFTINFNYSP